MHLYACLCVFVLIILFYKSVPNPELYTNDSDYQCLTNGYNKIISIDGSTISNLGTHFNSSKNF